MKPRSKEENAAHARAQRLKKKMGSVSPGSVPPVRNRTTRNAAPCPNCATKDAEIVRLNTRMAMLEDQIKKQQEKPTDTSKSEDTAALSEPVVAAKVGRINSFNRGPVIGSARI